MDFLPEKVSYSKEHFLFKKTFLIQKNISYSKKHFLFLKIFYHERYYQKMPVIL